MRSSATTSTSASRRVQPAAAAPRRRGRRLGRTVRRRIPPGAWQTHHVPPRPPLRVRAAPPAPAGLGWTACLHPRGQRPGSCSRAEAVASVEMSGVPILGHAHPCSGELHWVAASCTGECAPPHEVLRCPVRRTPEGGLLRSWPDVSVGGGGEEWDAISREGALQPGAPRSAPHPASPPQTVKRRARRPRRCGAPQESVAIFVLARHKEDKPQNTRTWAQTEGERGGERRGYARRPPPPHSPSLRCDAHRAAASRRLLPSFTR